MDHAAVVRGFERAGELRGGLQRVVEGKRPVGKALLQGRPLDELEDERQRVRPGIFLDAVDAADARSFSPARTRASRSKRPRRSGSSAKSEGLTLIATSRCSRASRAR